MTFSGVQASKWKWHCNLLKPINDFTPCPAGKPGEIRDMEKTIKVYCGTYGKYNSGSIDGAWVDLSDFSDIDEFMEHIRALHKDERDPEFMFQDVDNYTDIPISGEPGLYEIERFIQFLNLPEYEREILEGYASIHGLADDIEEQLETAQDAYCGTYDTMSDYAEEVTLECHEIPDYLNFYIDWDKMARDFSMDHTQADNGMIFRDY